MDVFAKWATLMADDGSVAMCSPYTHGQCDSGSLNACSIPPPPPPIFSSSICMPLGSPLLYLCVDFLVQIAIIYSLCGPSMFCRDFRCLTATLTATVWFSTGSSCPSRRASSRFSPKPGTSRLLWGWSSLEKHQVHRQMSNSYTSAFSCALLVFTRSQDSVIIYCNYLNFIKSGLWILNSHNICPYQKQKYWPCLIIFLNFTLTSFIKHRICHLR